MVQFGGSNVSRGGGGRSTGVNYGRVVSVVMDDTHPKYYDVLEGLGVGGVFYRPVDSGLSEDDDKDLPFAFQGNASIRRWPLPGEIVALEKRPAPSTDPRLKNELVQRQYWTEVINTWNNPEHNANPDISIKSYAKKLFGDDFKEEGTINPLQLYPGDLSVEGRQGQSIRMTGTKHKDNEFVDGSNESKPLTIISNGQIETDNGTDRITEDVNEDAASIYLTSDHKVKLKEANKKRKAYKKKPDTPNKFKGAQVLINSDRLYFNAREENLLLTAKQSVGITADTLNFDGNKEISVDADQIFLGVKAYKDPQSSKEPLLKGKTSVEWLDEFAGVVEAWGKFLSSTMIPVPSVAIPQQKAYGGKIVGQMKKLRRKIHRLKSKKVYTE
jgi:hypothetical protein